jgi:hypothetical protein
VLSPTFQAQEVIPPMLISIPARQISAGGDNANTGSNGRCISWNKFPETDHAHTP